MPICNLYVSLEKNEQKYKIQICDHQKFTNHLFLSLQTFDTENEDITVTFEPIQTSIKSNAKMDEEENKVEELFNAGKISQHFNLSPDLKM